MRPKAALPKKFQVRILSIKAYYEYIFHAGVAISITDYKKLILLVESSTLVIKAIFKHPTSIIYL